MISSIVLVWAWMFAPWQVSFHAGFWTQYIESWGSMGLDARVAGEGRLTAPVSLGYNSERPSYNSPQERGSMSEHVEQVMSVASSDLSRQRMSGPHMKLRKVPVT